MEWEREKTLRAKTATWQEQQQQKSATAAGRVRKKGGLLAESMSLVRLMHGAALSVGGAATAEGEEPDTGRLIRLPNGLYAAAFGPPHTHSPNAFPRNSLSRKIMPAWREVELSPEWKAEGGVGAPLYIGSPTIGLSQR